MSAVSLAKFKSFLVEHSLYLITIITSFLFSLITFGYHQPFNVDGIIYLNAAAAFLQQGMHAAASLYSWPFYSILVALSSKLTSLSLENSAFLLDFIFITVTLLVFISIVKELGGDKQTQFFAALTILLYPFLNHDRDNILRDFGYYAFIFVSLLFFIRYIKHLKWRDLFCWSVCVITATFFRIEGVILLLFSPLVLLFRPQSPLYVRIDSFIRLYTIPILSLFFTIIYIKKHPINIEALHNNIAGLNQLYFFATQAASQTYQVIMVRLSFLTQVFFGATLLDHDAVPIFFFSGLVGVFFHYLICTTGFLYLVLAYHALRYKLIPADKFTFLGWITYIILTFITIGFFLVAQSFLSDRYVALPSLLLMVAVPFSLKVIYNNWRENKSCFTGKKWVFPTICVLLLINLVNSLGHFGTSKTYILKAGSWFANNTLTSSKVFCTDAQLAYYSHRIDMKGYKTDSNTDPLASLKQINIKNYNYIGVVINRNQLHEETQILALLKNKPILIFNNKKGDKAYIFKVSQTS